MKKEGSDVKKEDIPKLTPGSRYRVTSMMTRDEPLVSEGMFKGYTMVGGLDSLCIEVEAPEEAPEKKGKKASKKDRNMLRLVPCQMVIAIDVLDQVVEKEEKEPTTDSRYYM
jgi:hypothetical protein